MTMNAIAHAKWLNKQHTRLECNYKHPVFGWVPFTADVNDKSATTVEVFSRLNELVIEEYADPTVNINTLKEAKHVELKQARDKARATELIEYDGDYFTADKDTDQVNMNTYYSMAMNMIAGTTERRVITWMSYTNHPHHFVPEQIVQLAEKMRAKVEEIYGRYWYARDILLANASTPDEVNNIKFPDTLPIT